MCRGRGIYPGALGSHPFCWEASPERELSLVIWGVGVIGVRGREEGLPHPPGRGPLPALSPGAAGLPPVAACDTGLGPIPAVQPPPLPNAPPVSTSSSQDSPRSQGPCSWRFSLLRLRSCVRVPAHPLLRQQQLFPAREVTRRWGWSARGSQPAGTWMLKCRGGGPILGEGHRQGLGWDGAK